MRPFKRRREKKTDYKARLAMLKSGLPRLVARRYSRNVRVQVVAYSDAGDRTLVEINSSKIKNWDVHPGNIPSAYLAGYSAGAAALKKGVREAVLDIGLHTSTKGNAVYAAAKGAADAGLRVSIGEGVVPDEKRIRGEHISSEIASKLDEALANAGG